jgi:hypothetical protein
VRDSRPGHGPGGEGRVNREGIGGDRDRGTGRSLALAIEEEKREKNNIIRIK